MSNNQVEQITIAPVQALIGWAVQLPSDREVAVVRGQNGDNFIRFRSGDKFTVIPVTEEALRALGQIIKEMFPEVKFEVAWKAVEPEAEQEEPASE